MPINRHAYKKTLTSQCSSEGLAYQSTPSNYGNATTKVINVSNNNWLSDSVVFTVDSAWRYVVHVRNTNNGASSIHINDVRVYGKNTATYLACDTASGGYRFGFNGMEKDDEVKGTLQKKMDGKSLQNYRENLAMKFMIWGMICIYQLINTMVILKCSKKMGVNINTKAL